MIGYSNIHALFHDVFHRFYLYSYTNPCVDSIYQSAVIWFCCIVAITLALINCFFNLSPYLTVNTKC